jgi:hypothetical protein
MRRSFCLFKFLTRTMSASHADMAGQHVPGTGAASLSVACLAAVRWVAATAD